MLVREEFNRERIDELIREAQKHGPFQALTHEEREATRHAFLSQIDPQDGLWVFGYGSLLWNPAFHFTEWQPARLHGFRRRFCMKASIGRGSPDKPGLMLALDHGGSCNGRAFHIAPEKIDSETDILWMREMISGAYHARLVNLRLPGGTVKGLTFVINRTHSRYIREMDMEETTRLLATGEGHLGTCRDYLTNTIAHLDEMNVKDRYLHELQVKMRELDRRANMA
ncbi:MAG: gamma-glutamylcyclotransferase [Sneathiella sp.]|jgi:cation transport protein ChaC|uniref:gamma-glutamylcyclotransferase n=1 Tax=Sneathiella sp. TaxID=1964365 RepID=UPI000C6B37B5|nr:gamma-glutamylcyclotransferase [Sneathiella sp.]MAL77532.1 gamma-glutamylcyclotransferase [Sneathiella sp.]MAL78834.1 gamma-glutamylcyclotransferase [Sneathiella sp.]